MGEARICVYEMLKDPQHDVAVEWFPDTFLVSSKIHSLMKLKSLKQKAVCKIFPFNLVLISLITICMLAPLVGGLMLTIWLFYSRFVVLNNSISR